MVLSFLVEFMGCGFVLHFRGIKCTQGLYTRVLYMYVIKAIQGLIKEERACNWTRSDQNILYLAVAMPRSSAHALNFDVSPVACPLFFYTPLMSCSVF